MTAYPAPALPSNVIPLFPGSATALAAPAPPAPPEDASQPTPGEEAPPPDLFAPARAAFEAILDHLRADQTRTQEHADIEDFLEAAGTDLMRRLLQSHLALRAHTETRGPITGAEDTVRTQRRKERKRGLESLFGEVDVYRIEMRTPGLGGLRPMDAELNLPDDAFSFGVRKRVAREVARLSFNEARDSVNAHTGAHIAKRQVEVLAVKAARDFEAFYETRSAPPEEDPADLVVVTTDAKGVVMHTQDLRPATRKKAETQTHKLTKRLSSGEKKNRKRMAQVVSVYSVPAVPRTPEEVVYDKTSRQRRPRPKHKRVWASLEKSAQAMVVESFEEGLRRDERLERTWVGLVDGDPHQVAYLQGMAWDYGVRLTLVLDVIHVLEYVWKAAWCLYPKGDPAAEAWVEQRLLRLLAGKAVTVAAGMRRSATLRELSKTKRKGIDKCADYLLKYARLGMLDYDRFLADGLPIATGVIEGACRYLVQDRMGITGARWRLTCAEAVLKLRALHTSGDLDVYWTFHRQQELQRNHLQHYADTELTHLRAAG